MSPDPRALEPAAHKLVLWALAVGTFAAGLYVSNSLAAVWRLEVKHPATEIVTRLLLLFWLWAPLVPLVWWTVRRFPVAGPHVARRLLLHLGFGLGFWIAHALL